MHLARNATGALLCAIGALAGLWVLLAQTGRAGPSSGSSNTSLQETLRAIEKQLQRLDRQQQQLVSSHHQPKGLYIGNGKVLCYSEPLERTMVLEAQDKGLTVHICRGLGWEPELASFFRR